MTIPGARRLLVVAGLTLALLLAACGGDDSSSAPNSTAAPAIETVPLPSSLVQVAKDVAQLRGLPVVEGVKMGFVPRASVPALLDQLLSDEDRAQFTQTTTLYRLLGHFRPDEDYLSVYRQLGSESVAGLYSPPGKTLWVVQPGDAPPNLDNLPRETRSTLAHELVHATQDAAFNLETLSGHGDLDATLALTCLIEGDAVTHQSLYEAKYLASLESGRNALLAGFIADIPPSLNREFFFPYTTCAEWVRSIRDSGGTAAIDALFRDPPKSTALILHPERGSNWQPEAVTLPDLLPGLGSGWKRESGGTFGEFQVRNYLQLRLPGLRASTAAAGWAGDRYDVYAHDNDSVAVFRLVFADDTEATEFRAAQDELLGATGAKATTVAAGVTLASRPDGNTTARRSNAGREVFFAIGSSADAARRAISLLGGG